MLASGFGRRIWSIICIPSVIILLVLAAEAKETMQIWQFTYRLYPVGRPGDSEQIVFSESKDFSRIDRDEVSFIIGYRQKEIYRIDHRQKTVCNSSVSAEKNAITRQLHSLSGSYEIMRTGIQRPVSGFTAEKIHIRFGSAAALHRTMAPVAVHYLGEIFREQTVTAWVTKDVPKNSPIFSILTSHAELYKEMPLLLQLATPALFTSLGGYIVRMEFNGPDGVHIMDLKDVAAVAPARDFFSIPEDYSSIPCEHHLN